MITEPMPFIEAIRFLLEKEQLPADWDAAMWQDQEPDFQTKAFFSAKVENARFLDRSQGLIFDYMAKVRETIVQPDGTVVTALKVAGREHFVKRLRDFMITEGMAKHHEFKDVDQKDITDIRSLARLRLIFDTNVRQAYGFGQWKQGMTPAVLKAFPAARLIRDRGVKEPRPRHQRNLGEVLLKTDPRWAEFHNAREIGGFGLPWGPYGFNSGVTQEDVSKAEAIRHGLKLPDQTPEEKKIYDDTWASVRNIDPAIKAKLIAEIEARPKPRDIGEVARNAAADTRRIMLNRGLADAEARGDASKAGKYRKAIADLLTLGLLTLGLQVRDEGDKIMLEKPVKSVILPAISNENNSRTSGVNPAITRFGNLGTEGDPIQPDGDQGGSSRPAEVVKIAMDRAVGKNAGGKRSTPAVEAIREREALRDAAVESPDIVLADLPESELPKTNEHTIRIDEETGRYWKYTIGDGYGYIPSISQRTVFGQTFSRLTVSEASPSQYLRRVELMNRIFGDDIRIEGITKSGGLVVSQPGIAGRAATGEEIDEAFLGMGWIKIPNDDLDLVDQLRGSAWYSPLHKVVVVDARPANCVRTRQGKIAPIDIMISDVGDNFKLGQE